MAVSASESPGDSGSAPAPDTTRITESAAGVAPRATMRELKTVQKVSAEIPSELVSAPGFGYEQPVGENGSAPGPGVLPRGQGLTRGFS